MMPMGPEALMVRSKIDARVELAEFLRLEYSRADGWVVGAMIRGELDRYPPGPAPAQRLRQWGRRLLRRGDGPGAESPAVRALPGQASAEGRTARRARSGVTLAAMPAGRGARGAEEGSAPIAAIPVLLQS